jgi:hypothetical protein
LIQTIDKGLNNSRFGVVILSKSFFAKQCPRRELDGLTAIEMSRKRKTVLPVWPGAGKADVEQFSPALANKVAANTADGLERVATQIYEAIPKRGTRTKLRPAMPAPAARSTIAGRDSDPPIVLVVEDDPAIRELEAWTLRREGCAVLEAEDGRYGLVNARLNVPDLIILDLLMPDTDGLTVLRELKAQPGPRQHQ